ncbi:MAG: TlpA family protein disulfide reductase [Nitrosomonadales bacterium]|nr:TlpA family protein disulfide reductase [Nitrosomonadales bacterium]
MVRVLLVAVMLLAPLHALATEFSFKDTRGQLQRLSDYRGKWVLVNFWATWCPPCLDEIPDLIALHDAHKDTDLVVLGIALEYASQKGVKDFAEKHAISYPIILGNQKMAEQVGYVGSLPTSVLFDPAGKAAGYQEGAVTRAIVEEYIRSKTKKQP